MEKKQTYITLAVAAVVAIGVSALIVVGSVNKSAKSDNGAGEELKGLQETEAPFQPEYANLQQRIQALKVPPPGTEKYHVHAKIGIFIDGKPQVIPTNIGLDQARGIVSALHSHDPDGIVHMEADAPFEATLSDYFGIWGVKFSNTQLGAYKSTEEKKLEVYVEGKKIEDPANYVIKAKDRVIVGYGTAGSFPTTPQNEFPAGL